MDALTSSMRLVKALFDWRVILDVLLIAAVLYFLYRTLLRLGTWKIVTGILLAIALFVIANVLDLKGTRWIYSNVSQVALIALIVIFQPELRKLLERAASLRAKKMTKGGSDLAVLFSDALFTLAEQKRGALVVFPGREPTTEWLSGGLMLDAEPTFPIIISIFDPHSPGHDGALIVENGRLKHFGVRLPISTTGRLTEECGTRHHAAMGLSEATDALVVAVSEERGVVTTFRNGRAEKASAEKDIAIRIMSHWEETATYAIELYQGRKRRDSISQMAISLVLALAFYSTVIVAQMEMTEKAFTVPVVYVGAPDNLALVGNKPTEIKLHVTGPKSELDEINPSNMGVKIDLSTAKAGGQVFVVSKENVSLPRDVKLVDADPSNLALTLEDIQEFVVDVQPQLVGTLPKGLELVSVELNPKQVLVLSPAGDSKQKINVVTTPIYLESIGKNMKTLQKVIAPPNVQPKGKKWPDIEVTVVVRPKE